MSIHNSRNETIVFFSVLFHPEENALKNIMRANKCGYKSIVYINKASMTFMDKLGMLDVKILGENENVGLGRAFSDLEIYLKKENINYYVYFDQDTVVPEESWMKIKDTYYNIFKQSSIGMIFYGSNKVNNSGIVISSGCFFSLDVIKEIGNHDSDFFVEGVDYEFCIRLKRFGYKISYIHLNSIDHTTLQDGKYFKIFGLTFKLRIYGKSRLKDFNRAHKKLLLNSLKLGQFRMTLFFIKSWLAFNMGELFSRVLKRFH